MNNNIYSSSHPPGSDQPSRQSSGRTPQDQVSARDDALLDTAKRLFLERGYGQVSMELIAGTAGVAGRTIYQHFGGKRGLLSHIIEAARENDECACDYLWEKHKLIEPTLRAVACHLLGQTLSPTSRRLHADAFAARDMQLAHAIDPLHAGPWRDLLARCFATALWKKRFGSGLGAHVLCDMFLGCVMGAQSRALRNAPEGALSGDELLAVATSVTRTFLSALSSNTG